MKSCAGSRPSEVPAPTLQHPTERWCILYRTGKPKMEIPASTPVSPRIEIFRSNRAKDLMIWKSVPTVEAKRHRLSRRNTC